MAKVVPGKMGYHTATPFEGVEVEYRRAECLVGDNWWVGNWCIPIGGKLRWHLDRGRFFRVCIFFLLLRQNMSQFLPWSSIHSLLNAGFH